MHIYMHKAVNVAPKDNNPYAWWSYGLEVMETGTSMVLDGISFGRVFSKYLIIIPFRRVLVEYLLTIFPV